MNKMFGNLQQASLLAGAKSFRSSSGELGGGILIFKQWNCMRIDDAIRTCVTCAVVENLWRFRRWLPADFCGLVNRRSQPEHCSVGLSSPPMRMNVRHYAWSAMTTIFALRECWQILKSHTLTESAAPRFCRPPPPKKISLFFLPSFLSLLFHNSPFLPSSENMICHGDWKRR